jgi:hypothetical protein
MYYRCGAEEEAKKPDGFFSLNSLPLNSLTPSIKNIRISGINARNCRASAGFIAGLPESPVENLDIRDCEFSTQEDSGVSPEESDMYLGIPPAAGKSFRLLNIKGAEFKNVKVKGPPLDFLYQ